MSGKPGKTPQQRPPATTPSGIEIPAVATSGDHAPLDEMPGAYPFTRGIFADGYPGGLWTIRQYSGFATAEDSNARYRFLLDQGQTGLSVALDLPTQCGYDPMIRWRRPRSARSAFRSQISPRWRSFSRASILRRSQPLSRSTARLPSSLRCMSHVPTSSGVPRKTLTGTIQNDILKEYVARGTWIFPVRPSMRLIADSILFSNHVTPRFNPISIAGAHVRDAGWTAVEEMAYTLANGLAYVDELLRRGGDADKFAKRLSFFFYVHMDFFEEVCKFRAGRRVWAKLLAGSLRRD